MTNSLRTTDQIRSSDPLASSLHSQPIAPPPASPPRPPPCPPPCPPLQYPPSPPLLRLPTPLHLPNPLPTLLIQHPPRAPGPRRRRLAIQPFHQPLARHQNRPVHSRRQN